MRRMALVVVVGAMAVTGLMASPALAKSQHGDLVRGTAVITGPGLDDPISIDGILDTGGPPGCSTCAPVDTFSALVGKTGLLPFDVSGDVADAGTYGLAPDPSTLGKRYSISVTLSTSGDVELIEADLYPYAQGGPYVFAHPGQRALGTKVPSAWYAAPASLFGALVSLGFPDKAPVPPAGPVTAPQPAPPVAQPIPANAGRVWAIIGAVLALLTMVTLGSIAGYRQRQRSMRVPLA
jgi:hypothetical protein